MSTLRLEKRGMDFYKNCPEIKVSDLGNFRFYGEIICEDESGFPTRYEVEITTHERRKKGDKRVVDTWVDTCAWDTKKNCCVRVPDKCFYCKPTKSDLLFSINSIFKMGYDNLEIVSKLDNC